jgi:predicted dehydrogenase
LGNIAQGYDVPEGPVITTHVKACLRDPELEIGWIADVDVEAAYRVKTRWGLSAAVVDPESMITQGPDIVCVASPDETHARFVRAALRRGVRLVLCEKPLALSAEDAAELAHHSSAAGIPIAVNFMRRWLPGVADWLRRAAAGEMGLPQEAACTYYRGFRHNCCHWLDFIGTAIPGRVRLVELGQTRIHDFSAGDPTLSARVEIDYLGRRVPVHISGVDRSMSAQFSLDLRFEHGRLQIWNDAGIRVDAVGPGYRHSFHDSPACYMGYVWGNIQRHLVAGEALVHDARDALPGMALVDQIAAAARM